MHSGSGRNSGARAPLSPEEIWHRDFARAHAELYHCAGDAAKLRLILGVGRGGTSWLARALAATETPIRYVHEVLPHLSPRYCSSRDLDPTAADYLRALDDEHSLVRIYRMTTCPSLPENLFVPGYYPRKIRRDDTRFELVLHKEVHALLATEGLVGNLGCPTVVVTRNPVYVVDSLFAYQDIAVPIWRHEFGYVQKPDFLERFAPGKSNYILRAMQRFRDDGADRTSVIVGKALTVGVINRMFEAIALGCGSMMHVAYEDLVVAPVERIAGIAQFLGLAFGTAARQALSETLHAADAAFDPMSIRRDTQGQLRRPFRSLSSEEGKLTADVLSGCGLIRSHDYVAIDEM